jgi:hypothetical protein
VPHVTGDAPATKPGTMTTDHPTFDAVVLAMLDDAERRGILMALHAVADEPWPCDPGPVLDAVADRFGVDRKARRQ